MSPLFDWGSLPQPRLTGNRIKVHNQCINTDLKVIPIGGIGRRLPKDNFSMPAKCSAPGANLRVGEVGAEIVGKAISYLCDKSEISRDDLPNQAETITRGDTAAVGAERAIRLQ